MKCKSYMIVPTLKDVTLAKRHSAFFRHADSKERTRGVATPLIRVTRHQHTTSTFNL